MNLPVPVDCDIPRLAQLFSNLLANAVTHRPEGVPIKVSAMASDDVFILSIANGGVRLPDALLPNLFMRFERGGDRPSREGLGLGLFIASEIAAGHGGTLTVVSGDDETVFKFQMPNTSLPPPQPETSQGT